MNLVKKTISILSICVFSLALALPVSAKVEGDTIILGAAVSYQVSIQLMVSIQEMVIIWLFKELMTWVESP